MRAAAGKILPLQTFTGLGALEDRSVAPHLQQIQGTLGQFDLLTL